MLSDHQIKHYLMLADDHRYDMPDTARTAIRALVAELTRLRTREYREPRNEDDGKLVWIEGESYMLPAELRMSARLRGYYDPEHEDREFVELPKGALICPVESKPSPPTKEKQ